VSCAFDRLVAVMTRLREEGGCPWDREQTLESLKPFLLEEAYEVLEAIDSGVPDALCEELGDLLFQVLFHAQIAKEHGQFDIEAVLIACAEKMTRRHPHIFAPSPGDGAPLDSQTVLTRWEEMKKGEARHQGRMSALDGVPKPLPALLRAQKIQSRAARVGFDFRTLDPVFDKLREEVGECEAAVRVGSAQDIAHEVGDLLFSIVNVSRHLQVNPEEALRKAIERFSSRFQKVEAAAEKEGGIPSLTPAQMEQMWEAAKAQEGLPAACTGRDP